MQTGLKNEFSIAFRINYGNKKCIYCCCIVPSESLVDMLLGLSLCCRHGVLTYLYTTPSDPRPLLILKVKGMLLFNSVLEDCGHTHGSQNCIQVFL